MEPSHCYSPSGELIFCYSQQNPTTLVMLYPPEKVIKKMFKPPDPLFVLWIIDDPSGNFRCKADQIEKETGSKIMEFYDLAKVKEFLFANKQLKKVTIICKPEMLDDAKHLNRRKQISTIIEYPAHCAEQNYYEHQPQNQAALGLHILKAENQEGLLDCIKDCCQTQLNYRELLNFVTLKGDVWKSNVLVRTMVAMVNQPVDIKSRQQMVGWFEKLISKISKQGKMEQFINQLGKGPLPFQRALYWYTHQVGVYRIVNNLLRSCSHPSEIFYLQPFFKELFQAIQALEKQTQPESFVCYRGGSLYKEQILELQANVGQIIKNLSFLSTSLSQKISESFKKNAIFEIIVPRRQEQTSTELKFGYGYAKIKQLSQFQVQQEILFNPLCSFKILQVKEIQDRSQYFIRLKYERLTEVIEKSKVSGQQYLKEAEKKLYSLGKLWKQQQDEISCQGSALFRYGQSLQNTAEYWRKYSEIGKSCSDKINGLIQLGRCQKSNGHSCLKIFQRAMEIFKENYNNIEIEQMDVKNSQIDLIRMHLYYDLTLQLLQVQMNMGNYLETEQKSQKQMKLIGKQNKYYANFLSILARSLSSLGRFQKAAKLFTQLYQIYKTKFGQYHLISIHCLMNLADTLGWLGKNSQSRNLLQKCSHLILSTAGERHPAYRRYITIMANNLLSSEQYNKSIQIFEKCCEFIRKTSGIDNIQYVIVLNSFARLLNHRGKYERAQELCQIAVKICEKNYEESYEFVIRYINSLNQSSSILRNQLKYEKALQKAIKSCQISKIKFGQDHPDSIQSFDNLGKAFSFLGRLTQAELVIQKCCKIQLKAAGQNNYTYISNLQTLANINRKKGNFQKSLKLMKKCLALAASLSQPKNTFYYQILSNYALLLQQTKKYKEAAQHFEQSYNFNLQSLGQAHPNTVLDLSKLGSTVYLQKRYSKALAILERCSRLSKEVFGEDSPDYFPVWYCLVMSHQEMGESEKAIQLQINGCKVLGIQNTQYLSRVYYLIVLLSDAGKFEEALQVSKTLLQTRDFKRNKLFARLLDKLANIHFCLGNYKKSNKITEELHQIVVTDCGKKNKVQMKKQMSTKYKQWKEKTKLSLTHSFINLRQML